MSTPVVIGDFTWHKARSLVLTLGCQPCSSRLISVTPIRYDCRMLNVFTGSEASVDSLEQSLIDAELVIGRIRAHQVKVLAVLDVAQVPKADGARSLPDWVAARLDVTQDTARRLVEATKLFSEDKASAGRLVDGDVSFDRAIGTARLTVSGAAGSLVADSAGYDLAGVTRLVARHRRVTRSQERDLFRDRFVAIQPSLDEASWRLWGQLPAVDGHIIETALLRRGEQLPAPIGAVSRTRRHADALVAIAQDSIGTNSDAAASSSPIVSVFVDAAVAAGSKGEAGAEIAAGPKAGPATLERLLCEGAVQVIATDGLKPVAASPTTRAIAPAVRRFVLFRDSDCVIDGCASRYRLQPHHVIPRSEGGSHDPANLATLCWYHHHVAIHGTGYRLDPKSPQQRRHLLPPTRGPD